MSKYAISMKVIDRKIKYLKKMRDRCKKDDESCRKEYDTLIWFAQLLKKQIKEDIRKARDA